MKPHEPKKTGIKQEWKRMGKTMGNKKPNQKKRKGNKMLSQKSERGGKNLTNKRWEKSWQKGNKKEGTEDQCSGTWIANFYSLLSNASTLVIHQAFKYFFTDSSHVKFDHHLHLF
jgi:hypothetical protein